MANHRLAYVEAHGAFARALSDGKRTEGQLEAVKREFGADWENYLQVGAGQSLIQRAADLAEAFTLRPYDSVHLAAADVLHAQSGETVIFACFDRKLNRAEEVVKSHARRATTGAKSPGHRLPDSLGLMRCL